MHDRHEDVNDGKQQSMGQQKSNESEATDDSPLEQTYRKTGESTK